MFKQDLINRQLLPLPAKVLLTCKRIEEFLTKNPGYASFSGGKDSIVLVDIIRKYFPHDNIPVVFCDTGLEFPEVRRFAVNFSGPVEVLRPTMTFADVVSKFGWPVISKDVSQKVYEIRTTQSEKLLHTRLYGDNKGNGKFSERWKWLIDEVPFKISHKCCKIMKEAPFEKYERKTGRFPITGEKAADSANRLTAYLKTGCNAFNRKRKKSKPLGFWTDSDIWMYINNNCLKYPAVYSHYVRTGCMLCLFGYLTFDPGRLKKLKQTHPKVYNYGVSLGIDAVAQYIERGSINV